MRDAYEVDAAERRGRGNARAVANGTARQQAIAFDVVFEGVLDLSLDVVHPLRHAGLTLAKGLDRAHFSNRTFTRGVHVTAKLQRVILAIKPSDLCGDVKAAAAGGFTSDPPGTTAFLKKFSGEITGPPQPIPETLTKLGPDLVTRADRAALTRARKVDARYEKFSTRLGTKWGDKLGSVLVAKAPPAGGFPTSPPPPASTRTAMATALAAL